MLSLDNGKEYIIHVRFKGSNPPYDTVASGESAESVIADIRRSLPEFQKIVIYEADTKEAVKIIRE